MPLVPRSRKPALHEFAHLTLEQLCEAETTVIHGRQVSKRGQTGFGAPGASRPGTTVLNRAASTQKYLLCRDVTEYWRDKALSLRQVPSPHIQASCSGPLAGHHCSISQICTGLWLMKLRRETRVLWALGEAGLWSPRSWLPDPRARLPPPHALSTTPLPRPSRLPGPGDWGPFSLGPQPSHTTVPQPEVGNTGDSQFRKGSAGRQCREGGMGRIWHRPYRAEAGNCRPWPGTSQAAGGTGVQQERRPRRPGRTF